MGEGCRIFCRDCTEELVCLNAMKWDIALPGFSCCCEAHSSRADTSKGETENAY